MATKALFYANFNVIFPDVWCHLINIINISMIFFISSETIEFTGFLKLLSPRTKIIPPGNLHSL